jgi:NADH-quinone oxidoreductase subunit I
VLSIDLLKGFAVTLKHVFRRRVTVQYPEQRRVDAPIFRGRHRLQRYADGLERCVGCALCAAVCPSEAIYIEAAENDPNHPISPGERYARLYQIHLLRCIFCGFCAEACPEDAIVMGPNYELSDDSRAKFVIEKEQLLTPPSEGFGEYESFLLPKIG